MDVPQLNCDGVFLWNGYRGIVRALESETANLNDEIPAAAQWFIYAGPRIYSDGGAVKHDEPGSGLWFKDGNGNPLGGLWDGEGGLNKERWTFWRERFAWVRDNVELGEEAKNAAREAVEAMRRVDGGA